MSLTSPTRPSDPTVALGIPSSQRRAIAQGLAKLLADTYTLYLKTHNFHWNVTGPMFTSLHTLFEEHYTELALAVDLIAERIRALGEPAPGAWSDFSRLATVSEAQPVASGVPDAMEMVRTLLADHETVTRTARAVFPDAEEGHDEATADLLTQRLHVHEKTAWMLRSLAS